MLPLVELWATVDSALSTSEVYAEHEPASALETRGHPPPKLLPRQQVGLVFELQPTELHLQFVASARGLLRRQIHAERVVEVRRRGVQDREVGARLLIAPQDIELVKKRDGLWHVSMEWGIANMLNGLGRYADALAAAKRASADVDDFGLSTVWVSHELIEAAVRSGNAELAYAPLDRLALFARSTGTDWAIGVELRCRALISDRRAAEPYYTEAIECLDGSSIRVAAARSHLLFGEWLRRESRITETRAHLHIAEECFTEIGMEGFARRARRELSASGDRPHKRSEPTLGEFTPQEEQIARLAIDGHSNTEIGALLFVSAERWNGTCGNCS